MRGFIIAPVAWKWVGHIEGFEEGQGECLLKTEGKYDTIVYKVGQLILLRVFDINRSHAVVLHDSAEAVSLTKRLRVSDTHNGDIHFETIESYCIWII